MNFLDRFWKNTQIPNFVNFLPVGAELLDTDSRGEANSHFLHRCKRA